MAPKRKQVSPKRIDMPFYVPYDWACTQGYDRYQGATEMRFKIHQWAEAVVVESVQRTKVGYQIEGRLKEDRSRERHTLTGTANVTIVNPDRDAARRIEAVAGTNIPCNWVPRRIQGWLADEELTE
jgi:hypothetical protein